MGMKASFMSATAVLIFSGGVAVAGNDISSCKVDANGHAQITRKDGSTHTIYSPLVSGGAVYSSDGSAGATKICNITDGVEETEIARISLEDLEGFHADRNGLNFTDQFVCATFAADPADISKVDITDHDLNSDIQNPDTIEEVILDTSLLRGHYADALIHADDTESKPIGVCITSSGYAAPLFTQS